MKKKSSSQAGRFRLQCQGIHYMGGFIIFIVILAAYLIVSADMSASLPFSESQKEKLEIKLLLQQNVQFRSDDREAGRQTSMCELTTRFIRPYAPTIFVTARGPGNTVTSHLRLGGNSKPPARRERDKFPQFRDF
uniref:Uncharacterized protein n=1 Tax=Glossina pallidipes TaxID=7398 RepID=A0A1B0AHU8_GLOPL